MINLLLFQSSFIGEGLFWLLVVAVVLFLLYLLLRKPKKEVRHSSPFVPYTPKQDDPDVNNDTSDNTIVGARSTSGFQSRKVTGGNAGQGPRRVKPVYEERSTRFDRDNLHEDNEPDLFVTVALHDDQEDLSLYDQVVSNQVQEFEAGNTENLGPDTSLEEAQYMGAGTERAFEFESELPTDELSLEDTVGDPVENSLPFIAEPFPESPTIAESVSAEGGTASAEQTGSESTSYGFEAEGQTVESSFESSVPTESYGGGTAY